MGRLLLGLAVVLMLATGTARAQSVAWQSPRWYSANTTFTAASLPGAIVLSKSPATVVFTLPAATSPGLPTVPCLAYFEADGQGGIQIKAPSGLWYGVPMTGGTTVILLQFGKTCVWTDGTNWHLSGS
jgi:hypothetical protein